MTPTDPVNIDAALTTFHEIYSPRVLARVNDYDVKIAKVDGDHVWHVHENTDEFFLLVSGDFRIALRGEDGTVREVTLCPNDTFVVPRGMEHKPSSTGGVIMMFEPRGTVNTGDRHDELPTHLTSTTGTAL